MKKDIIFKLISIVFALISIFMVGCAITVKGSGVLDLSNIAKMFFTGVAIVCAVPAVVLWKCSGKQE